MVKLCSFIQWMLLGIVKAFKSPLCRHLGRAMPLILIISAITFSIEYVGWLDNFENSSLDAINLLNSPLEPSHLVLIGITDQDYLTYFSGTSPLNPEVLCRVIDAIASGQPRAIGIDLDTSSGIFQRLHVPETWPPLVWGQDAAFSGDQLEPVPVLGNQAIRKMDAAGIAALPQDSDGVIRRYLRAFPTSRDSAFSFPWEVVRVACNTDFEKNHPDAKKDLFCRAASGRDSESAKALRLNFSGERYTFSPLSVANVLQAAQGTGWRVNGPLHDKVVLFGGYYRAARDFYVTPVGKMAGLQLMAQAVESELGGGIRLQNHLSALILDMICGLILVLIHYRLRLALAVAISLVAIPLLAICGSAIAFHTFAWWINFVPITLGVLIHQLYNHAAEYQRLQKELVAYRESAAIASGSTHGIVDSPEAPNGSVTGERSACC
jgi:CHASE2 domain-containing sensor protein